MGRPAVELKVTAQDRMQLESIVQSQSLPAALSRRAQMILRLADGESNSAVARRFRTSRPTVSLWRKRYAEQGIAGLHNDLKPGRPRSTREDEIAALINTTSTRMPPGRTRWSQRALADETGLSKSTVHRYLTMFGLQPHRSTSFKLSNDPFFIEEVRDIVGLYLTPPDHALVLCVDEKSQCQDLERTQPVLPMGLGYVEGITHDCVRHGTKTLFAAIGVANGTVRTNMHFVDLTKYFCVRGQCPAVTDNLVEYRDDSHMTVEYPRTLAPMPERKIAGALPAGRL